MLKHYNSNQRIQEAYDQGMNIIVAFETHGISGTNGVPYSFWQQYGDDAAMRNEQEKIPRDDEYGSGAKVASFFNEDYLRLSHAFIADTVSKLNDDWSPKSAGLADLDNNFDTWQAKALGIDTDGTHFQAELISKSIPTEMTVGNNYQITVKLRNTGQDVKVDLSDFVVWLGTYKNSN